jgi:hypothetical protein
MQDQKTLAVIITVPFYDLGAVVSSAIENKMPYVVRLSQANNGTDYENPAIYEVFILGGGLYIYPTAVEQDKHYKYQELGVIF